MRLVEYSDDELIEELKHRGIKIEVLSKIILRKSATHGQLIPEKIKIGGVTFDLRT